MSSWAVLLISWLTWNGLNVEAAKAVVRALDRQLAILHEDNSVDLLPQTKDDAFICSMSAHWPSSRRVF
jgi:hypothetical protein